MACTCKRRKFRLEPDNSPYRSPRSPATKRFQPALNTDTGDSVQVVKDRRVELRAVTVGVTNRGFAEARTGLAAGEIVIARAAAFLRNGDEVRFGVRVSTPWISAGAEWPWVRWLAFAASVVAVRPELPSMPAASSRRGMAILAIK